MTHCLGSLASLSNASSARTREPCSANRPKIDVVTTRIFLIRFLPFVNEGFRKNGPLFSFIRRYPSWFGNRKLAQEGSAFARKRNKTNFLISARGFPQLAPPCCA